MRAPHVDLRSRADVLQQLLERLGGYLGSWTPDSGSAAMAVVEIFTRDVELLIRALNEAPDRAFAAFLETIGVGHMPAQAARAPLVFVLMDNSPVDVTLPPNSQVAARPPMSPPSLAAGTNVAPTAEPIVFTARQTITLARARLATLSSLDPDSDETADHSARLVSGFTLFSDMARVEHAIYLGHDHLFNLPTAADVILTFSLGTPAGSVREDFMLEWQYFSADGWRPLEVRPSEGLLREGQVALHKPCGPESLKARMQGRTSYWIRGRLTTPLPPGGTDGLGTVPAIDMIRARVGYSQQHLTPDAAFVDVSPLDTSGPFRPFGQQPVRYTTFYLASRPTFERKGARVRINFNVLEAGGPPKVKKPATAPELAWEYFGGGSWKALSPVDPQKNPFSFSDGSDSFTEKGARTITFLSPDDWTETAVNGLNNLWLRARLTTGDYGKPARVEGGALVAGDLRAPVVAKLTLAYVYLTDPEPVDHVLSSNHSVWEDSTQASHWPRETFVPFKPVPDRRPAVYFGFDRALPVGLISLYVHVTPDGSEQPLTRAASAFVWEYFSARGWSELGVLDESRGFRVSGMIQFVGPVDAVASIGPGGDLFRIRARLKLGERVEPLPVAGMWVNAVWATHGQVFDRENVGTSDGQPNQALRFPAERVPVLDGETVEVREWVGRGSGWESLLQEVSQTDIRYEREAATGMVSAAWVRWHRHRHLFASAAADRHYTLDGATGVLRFGDGRYGLIPVAGAPVVATYRTGGDLRGNVPAGAVNEIRSAVPYVLSVSNPIPAAGGAAIEHAESLQARGPQYIRHLDRAVSTADFEWLAREATPVVARARCLPVTGADGRVQRGWVTIAVVPHSNELRPQPDAEVRARVRDHVSRRVPAAIARRVRVIPPQYLPVSIAADLTPSRADEASHVEARVRERLNRFLHPLTGGDGTGWAFGESVYLSQVAAVVEQTPGVDFARDVRLHVRGELYGDVVAVPADTLIAPGDHEIKLSVSQH